ncbi:hypothetical protein OsJ_31313 [Oryza sativa Japonica Group]|uniref:Retrotransposon protein, putative, unclassified n=1 Tax=Oryza sativa subsp. japonica TaxID=39947 RepID=B9G5G5_ORYSJ|nr:hypothetical protein OsJ_31313 [Oryza sativa Japonica Group]
MMPIGVVNIATARRPGVMLSPWALKTVDYRCLAHHLAQQLNFATTQDDTTLEEQTLLIHPCCHQSSLKDITAPSVGLGCGSAPMYAMGFYLLPEGFHSKMDSARSIFYCQGVGEKKKYHMIKWEALCRPKDFRGMGFLDTRIMNISLLSKWVMKLENGAFSRVQRRGALNFGKVCINTKKHLQRLVQNKVHEGSGVDFWGDVWYGDAPLKVTFHMLYEVVYRSISFAQKWKVFLKEEERKALEDWLEAILDKLKQVRPTMLPVDL